MRQHDRSVVSGANAPDETKAHQCLFYDQMHIYICILRQLSGMDNAWVVKDELEFPVGQSLPLWMFGFLY